MKIIYPQPTGEIAITFECPGWGMAELAKLTTPNGVPYLILEDSDLPADWSTSAAWGADFSNPHGIGMGPHRYLIARAESRIAILEALPEPEKPEGSSDDVHAAALEAFATGRDSLIAQQQAVISQMKDEVFKLEGVQL